MRRCAHTAYPQREDVNDQGVTVRIVALPPVPCRTVAVVRSTVVWPGNGERQHIYACDVHTEWLRALTVDAGFPWEPHPYTPGK